MLPMTHFFSYYYRMKNKILTIYLFTAKVLIYSLLWHFFSQFFTG